MEGWVTDWALVRTKVLHGFRRSIKYNILTRVWAMASEEIKQFIIRWLNFHGIPCGKLGHNIKCIHESMICFWTVLLCFGPCVNWRNGFRFWCWPRIQLHVLFEFQKSIVTAAWIWARTYCWLTDWRGDSSKIFATFELWTPSPILLAKPRMARPGFWPVMAGRLLVGYWPFCDGCIDLFLYAVDFLTEACKTLQCSRSVCSSIATLPSMQWELLKNLAACWSPTHHSINLWYCGLSRWWLPM